MAVPIWLRRAQSKSLWSRKVGWVTNIAFHFQNLSVVRWEGQEEPLPSAAIYRLRDDLHATYHQRRILLSHQIREPVPFGLWVAREEDASSVVSRHRAHVRRSFSWNRPTRTASAFKFNICLAGGPAKVIKTTFVWKVIMTQSRFFFLDALTWSSPKKWKSCRTWRRLSISPMMHQPPRLRRRPRHHLQRHKRRAWPAIIIHHLVLVL